MIRTRMLPPALIDRCSVEECNYYIQDTIFALGAGVNPVLYYPDESAAKKYSDIFSYMPWCYGKKKRRWEDGKILGLDIITNEIDIKGRTILMIDDIISYGGTMYYGAQELKKLGAAKVYAYATHTENSVLMKKSKILKAFDEKLIEKIYTTDSIFRRRHDKIEVTVCDGGGYL